MSNNTNTPRLAIMTASAQMPASCKYGPYKKVAVVSLDQDWPEGKRPAMISERAKGVSSVLALWDRCYAGAKHRGAYDVALDEAKALIASHGVNPEFIL